MKKEVTVISPKKVKLRKQRLMISTSILKRTKKPQEIGYSRRDQMSVQPHILSLTAANSRCLETKDRQCHFTEPQSNLEGMGLLEVMKSSPLLKLGFPIWLLPKISPAQAVLRPGISWARSNAFALSSLSTSRQSKKILIYCL